MTEQKFEVTEQQRDEPSPEMIEREIRQRVKAIAKDIASLSTVEHHLNGLKQALPGAQEAVFAPIESWLRQRQRTALMASFELLEDVTGETDHALRWNEEQGEDS